MPISLQKLINKIKDKLFLKREGLQQSVQDVQRHQWLLLMSLCLLLLGVSYGIVTLLFNQKESSSQKNEPQKVPPTSIETASHKVDPNEAYRQKIEEDFKALAADLNAFKAVFEEGMKPKPELAKTPEETSEIHARLTELESRLEAQAQQRQGPASQMSSQGYITRDDSEGTGELITKFSLNLTSQENKTPRTVDSMIPAGAFARTILLSGIDASTSMTASSDPRPMLLRLIDHGTLPRKFQSDLKDCHCTASAYGDLSSERVYGRLEKLSCIDKKTGEILETQVSGYIAGSDGKTGIRGIVASKDGQFLSRSLLGGFFAGLSNVANPQNRQAQVNPFIAPGSTVEGQKVSPPSMGAMFGSGMATGVTTALDRLSQYYIDRAEQLQPVIQVAAGQVVDVVFLEGCAFESH